MPNHKQKTRIYNKSDIILKIYIEYIEKKQKYKNLNTFNKYIH